MFSYLEERTPAEVEAIRRTIQELLRQTCILQVKYDPVTLTARDNARYQVCLKHREFIADYLSVIGCELVHDPQDHLFRITGDGAAIEKMSLTTTKLLLLFFALPHPATVITRANINAELINFLLIICISFQIIMYNSTKNLTKLYIF